SLPGSTVVRPCIVKDTATTSSSTLSLHDALPISDEPHGVVDGGHRGERAARRVDVEVDVLVGGDRFEGEQLGHDVVGRGVVDRRSEEHTSELQSRENLVCRLLLEKKNKI